MAIGMRRLAAVLAAILFAALPATSGERVLARPHMATDDSREDGHVARQGRRGRGRSRGRLLSSTAVFLAASGARALEFVQSPAELLALLDTNGDGKVDREEYSAPARKAAEESGLEEQVRKQAHDFVHQLFDAADIDADGFLNQRELEYADLAREMALLAADSTDEVPLFDFGLDTAASSLYTFDTDANGEIGKEEYLEGMRSFAADWRWLGSFDRPELVKWMDDTWSKVDITGDAALNVDEVNFLLCLVTRDADSGMFSPYAFAGQVLEDLDTDGDSKVSVAELAKLAEDLAAKAAGAEGPEETGTEGEAPVGEATEGGATEGEAGGAEDATPGEDVVGAEGEGEPEATHTPSFEIVDRMQALFHEVDADKDERLDLEELTELSSRLLGEL